jgi:hypothetical protein
VLDSRALKFDMVIEMVKTHKSPGTEPSTVELFTEGSRTIRCESHKLLFGIRENCLWCGRSRSLMQFIRRVIKQIIVMVLGYHVCQLCTKFYPSSTVKFISLCRGIYLGLSMWISRIVSPRNW